MLGNFNLNNLRVFQAVFEHKSMTKAAQKIFLTQSGVSQHIKNLEDTLNITLFDRIGKSLIPTKTAQYLYDECKTSMDALQRTIYAISDGTPTGSITIGAPPEFAHNVLAPMLADLQHEHPRVIVHLHIGLASQMMRGLLDGEQDIAFLDDVATDSRLEAKPIFDETIILCARKSLLRKFPQPKGQGDLHKDLPLLEYLPGEPIIRKWYKHHFHKVPTKLNIVAYLSNSQNIARMISAGAGAGIITCHHFDELRRLGHDIVAITPSKRHLVNPITMNRVKQRSVTPLESVVANFLSTRFAKMKDRAL